MNANWWRRLAALVVLGVACVGAAVFAADFNTPSTPSVSVVRGSNSTTVTYRGQINYQYAIYGSTNMTNWTGLTTNLCTAAAMTFTETNRPARFYKATCIKTPLFYTNSFSGAEIGAFMVFVRTNDTMALVGYDGVLEGAFSNSLGVGTNNQCCGTIFANRTGCLNFTSNSVSGNLTNGTARVGTVVGGLKSNAGIYQAAAGVYSGTIDAASDCPGTMNAILAADGTFYFYVQYPSGFSDGGWTTITSGGFTVLTPHGAHYYGAISISQRVITGTFQHGCDSVQGLGNYSMTRTEKLF